jgi:mono/diheme cytochrome c family protein
MLAGALGTALAALAPMAPAQAFPWSIDMYRGPQVSTFTEAPREMPDGTLPIDGTHYNAHYGQPAGMPDQAALPPMKLEVMTVKMHNPLQSDPANLAKGQERFATNCAPCHGEKGLGDGPVVHLLHRKPANLLTGVSKNLPDGYIYGYIRNGGIAMPAYDDAMSSDERWQVVLYVRDLQRKYGAEAATASAAPQNPGEATGEHRETTDSDPTYSEIGSDSP